MDINQSVVLKSGFLLERIGSEVTVYHPSLTTSLYLNETGALIWEMCDGKRTVAEIISALKELYPESSDQISDGVVNIIASLVENDIAELMTLT